MNAASEQEATLIQYLLGRLREQDAERIEERLFADEESRDELLATADDLIHAYLAGTLSGEDRKRFETHFLASPRHRERVAYIRDLLSALKRVPGRADARRPLPRWLAPAWGLAAAIAVAVAGGLVWRLSQPSTLEVAQVTATPAPNAPVTLLPRLTASPTPLTDGASAPPLRRPPGGEVQVVRLPRPSSGPVSVVLLQASRVVRVEVSVDERRPSYEAALSTRDGGEVWRIEGLLPPTPGKPLLLELPAGLLTTAQYILRVEAEGLRGTGAPQPLVLEYSLDVVRAR